MAELARTEVPLTPIRPGEGGAASRMLSDARGFFAQPAVRKAMPLVVAAIAVVAVVLLWATLKSADYRPLFPNLAEEDKAAVVDALRAANFKVDIDEATGSVGVPAADYHKAKILLASQGLPKAAATGYDLLDKMPLGSSRALEAARLQQSQESELASSVAAISGVESARVHLALPEQSVFVRERTPPTASVFVKLSAGRALGEAQVRSIVHLVSSSVAGLSPDNVSVIDQSGALLTAAEGSDSLGESSKRVAYQSKLEDMYRSRLSSMLTPLLGVGNYTAEVHLDLDFTERQATREAYDRDGVLRTEQSSLQVQNGGAGVPRGIPGALSNTPPPAATVATPGAPAAAPVPAIGAPAADTGNGPRSENIAKSYDVGKEVSVTRTIAGDIKRATVAVVVRQLPGKKVSAADLKSIDQLIRGAIGIDAKRGDTVAITSRAFIDPTAEADAAQPWYQADWVMAQGKNVAFVLVAAMLLFGFLKPALRRATARADALTAPAAAANVGDAATATAAPALGLPMPSAETHADGQRRLTVTPEVLTAARGYDDKIALVRMLVSDDTARASNVLKGMMRAEMAGAAE